MPHKAMRRLRAHVAALCPVRISGGGASDTERRGPPPLPTHPNPSLHVHKVDESTLSGWMMPDVRRKHFRSPEFGHQNINMRSSSVLELTPALDDRIARMSKVRESTSHECFCGMVVLRGNEVLFERYHDDFSAETPHSMQSITKTTVNLMVGKLVEEGRLSLDTLVKDIVPEMDSGYADASLQHVLDMTVSNMFAEGYSDDYWDQSVSEGYARQEIGLGWRLPPPGEQRLGMRDFIAAIKCGDERRTSGYKSPNNDLMAWVVERVSGRSVASHMQDIIEATGIEGSFHCACDVDWVPITSGGGFMCTRDLARYGQLFCRRGAGVDGSVVGSGAFLDETRRPPESMKAKLEINTGVLSNPGGWYHNAVQTNGKYVGHGGFGGQWMAADEESGCSVAFFSVFNERGGIGVNLQEMSEEIFHIFR